jgi:hypothetical protein
MDNQQKIIDYFFISQGIELTQFHQIEQKSDGIMIVDIREKVSDVIHHQIVRFKIKESNNLLIANVSYIYENGVKSGMIFNNKALVEKMTLGQKCVSVLDKSNIKHYYACLNFTIELNTVDNTMEVTNCYQSINILNKHGPNYCLLEEIVTNIVNSYFKEWNVSIDNIPLTDLIDMYLMATI